MSTHECESPASRTIFAGPVRKGRRVGFLAGPVILLLGCMGTAHAEPAPEAQVVEAPSAAGQGPSPQALAQSKLLTEGQAMVQAKRTSVPVEVDSLTSETTRTVANPDGTFTVSSSPRPVRVKRGDSWAAVDNTLVRNSDGSIAPKVTAVPMRFSGGGNGPLATIKRDESSLSFNWSGHALPNPTLTGDTATYANVLPDVDLVVRADIDAFTEVLVVKNRAAAANPAIRKLSFTATGDGLTLSRHAAGTITAKDSAGETLFASPTPTMWDSSGIPVTRDGRTDRTQPGARARNATMASGLNGSTMTVTPDTALLDDADTTYPVQIDPAWSGGKLAWAYVSTSNTNHAYYNTTEEARVGHEDWDGSTKRSFFRMNTQGVAGKRILQASFWLNNTWSWSCSARGMQVWATNGIGSTTTWNNQPAWSYKLAEKSFAHGWHASGQSSTCPNPSGGVEFRVDAQVKSAAAGRWSTITLGLRASNETDAYGWKRFNNNPTLSIKYDTPPAVPTSYTTVPGTPCSGGSIGNTDISLRAAPQDADGGTITARFQYNKSGTTTWTTKDVNATSGQVATLALGRTLGTSGTWNWTVQTVSKDMNGVEQKSTWTPTCKFTIDMQAPLADVDVTSPTYPCSVNGVPVVPCAGGVAGQPANFTFTPKDPSTVALKVAFDDDTPQYRFNVSSAGTTITLTPTTVDLNTLHIRTVDALGNESTSTDDDYQIWAASPLTGDPATPHDNNSDAKPDVILSHADGRNCLYLGNGAGGWISGSSCSIEVTGPVGSLNVRKPAQVGDWDNDGINDLAYHASGKIYVATGRGAGRFDVAAEIRSDKPVFNPDNPTDVGYEPISFTGITDLYGPGDWDGDGQVDMIVRRSDGTMNVIYNNGNGLVDTQNSATGLHLAGTGWNAFKVVAAGDVTGDDLPDLLGIDTSGYLWTYPTATVSRTGVTYKPRLKSGAGWLIFAQVLPLADFNKNNTADIAGIGTDGKFVHYDGEPTPTPVNSSGYSFVLKPGVTIGAGWTPWVS